MDRKLQHYKTDACFDLSKVPDEWFMPVSELNGEHCKKYMDEEGRLKTLRATYEAMIKLRQKERAKK